MRRAWLAASAALITGLTLAPHADATSAQSYVSLGDSYTSAAGVQPMAAGAPLDCSQSAVNYPHLVASSLGLPLHDVSCGAATVQNMTTAQYPDQPAQFNALNSDVSVVTLGIGGNDNEVFASAIAACGSLDLGAVLDIGAPCQTVYGSYFDNKIDADASNIATALQQIHTLAPHARVFVVGYPDILPQQSRCYPQMPLTTGDVAYMNGVEQHLNSMLAQQAAANGATYIDTYTPSIGHDVCQTESVRWIEPPIPGSIAAPIHPNAAGEAADAQDVAAAFRMAGIN